MTASLALAWHITRTDLRPLRASIVVSVLLTLAQTLFRTVWPPLTMTLDRRTTEWIEPLITVLPSVRMLIFIAIVAALVHADPLVSTDAFWLTRPISRRVLFLSKVGTMLLVLALPAALAQAAPMIVYGVPPVDIVRLLSEYLLYFAVGLMMAFAAAALTPNQRSLVTWAFGLFVLWSAAAILMSNARTEQRSPGGVTTMSAPRSTRTPGPGLQVTMLVLIATGCGAAAWHQYRTRSRERSALIAAVTAGAVFVVPPNVPWARPEARSSFTAEPAVALGSGVRFQQGPRSVVMWAAGDDRGLCRVMVRVTQVQGIQSALTHPPAYRFIYRPTGRDLVFTYFALPDRIRELGDWQVHYGAGSEPFELFQVLYREVLVGPVFASRDPRDTTLRAVSCRDVDVVVRH